VLCEGLTHLLSDTGKPCHKTCAESWYEANPTAWEFYERRRDHQSKTKNPQAKAATDGGREAPHRVHAATLLDNLDDVANVA
jgi:hypothetical protein